MVRGKGGRDQSWVGSWCNVCAPQADQRFHTHPLGAFGRPMAGAVLPLFARANAHVLEARTAIVHLWDGFALDYATLLKSASKVTAVYPD